MSGEWSIDVALPLQCNPVKDYLDEKIRYWRGELKKRMAALGIDYQDQTLDDGEWTARNVNAEKAISYIDAYQTMRCDLFGEALPDE